MKPRFTGGLAPVLALTLAGASLGGCGSSGENIGPPIPPTPTMTHADIVLRDRWGDPLQLGSTEPYSPRQTCGECHDVDVIAQGYHFQLGRTDAAGNVQTGVDFFGNGQPWHLSPGMFGKWSPLAIDSAQIAAKLAGSISTFDESAYDWSGECASCHAGGGPAEKDRDDHLYYDVAAGQWGYEAEGLMSPNPADGDYRDLEGNGVGSPGTSLRDAPWDTSGSGEPDCLFCHRLDRALGISDEPLNWIWRTATLRAQDGLQDSMAQPVPAYAAASTAGQGWANVTMLMSLPGALPKAASVTIDYQLGLDDGSLYEDGDGNLRVSPDIITSGVRDLACWSCHQNPDNRRRGRTWFDPTKDVHFGKFNGDITAADADVTKASTACTNCHILTGDPLQRDREHNISKGSASLLTVRQDQDWVGMETCSDCHGTPPGTIHSSAHLAAMACEFCHIPYKLDAADVVLDNATTGKTLSYDTDQFYSSDPLSPAALRGAGDHKWWSDVIRKTSKDATIRFFPAKYVLSAWWGDWTDVAPAGPGPEDVVTPIPLWKIRHATGDTTPPGVVDDNGDGTPEVNTLAEIGIYIASSGGLLLGDDGHGQPIASNPVLVKSTKVYYWGGMGVTAFDYEMLGLDVTSRQPFSITHDVLPLGLYSDSPLGSGGCSDCHGTNTKGWDRRVLVDPFDTAAESSPGAGDGAQPIYSTVRNLLGLPANFPTFGP